MARGDLSRAGPGGIRSWRTTRNRRIRCVSRDPVDLRSSASAVGSAASLPLSGSGGGAREDVEALADDFRRRMGVLKKVVGEGEKRRAVTAQQQLHGHDDVAAAAESNEIHDPGTLRSGTASQTHDAATNTY